MKVLIRHNNGYMGMEKALNKVVSAEQSAFDVVRIKGKDLIALGAKGFEPRIDYLFDLNRNVFRVKSVVIIVKDTVGYPEGLNPIVGRPIPAYTTNGRLYMVMHQDLIEAGADLSAITHEDGTIGAVEFLPNEVIVE